MIIFSGLKNTFGISLFGIVPVTRQEFLGTWTLTQLWDKFLSRHSLILLLFLSLSVFGFSQKGKNKNIALAKEHLRFEEFERAIPVLRQLIESDSRNAYYNFWMGKSLYLTYQRNQALPYLEVTNEVDPNIDREFHYYYALTLHYNLKFDRAIEEYKLDLERYKLNSPDYLWVTNRIEQCLYAKVLSQKRIQGRVEINNMGELINSRYSEHSPVISGNDSVLLFTARRPANQGAKPEQGFYDEDIYISYQKEGKWSRAINIGKPVNSKGHDATISLNSSGDKLYLYRHKKQGGLYRTNFDKSGLKWQKPKPVVKPLNSRFYEASICESADSSIMFFTSDRPGGFGGRDIYMVKRDGKGKWGDPENLGAMINSPFDEDAPYFHPDGKTLYYSSNGPNSMGGFDIFITEFDSLMGSWLEPLNLGSQVNTPDDDIYFTVSASGKYGYFSSGKEGGFGEKDIYELEFPYFPFPRRYTIIELLGLVRDGETGEEINANVRLTDNQTKETVATIITSESNPPFIIELNPLTEYKVVISANGYTDLSRLITTPDLNRDEDVVIEKVFDLDKVSVETAVSLLKGFSEMPEIQHIYFDFDKNNLRPKAQSELDLIRNLLVDNPDLSLELSGHTDYYKDFDYNQLLSERRARSAYQYLIDEGVDDKQIYVAGFSENKPIETNHNDLGRQYNRRVEFNFFHAGEPAFSSLKLRKGSEGPAVDHAQPRGKAGYDNPEVISGAASGDPQEGDPWPPDDPNPDGLETSLVVDDSVASTSIDADESFLKSGGLPKGAGPPVSNVVSFAELDDLIRNVYFDFDASNLRGKSSSELQKIASKMLQNPDLKLEILGHTDSFGSTNYNQRLSESRAQTVYDFLIDSGIDSERLQVNGFSELKPIDSNGSGGGRQLNRRVEFKLNLNGKTWMKSVP